MFGFKRNKKPIWTCPSCNERNSQWDPRFPKGDSCNICVFYEEQHAQKMHEIQKQLASVIAGGLGAQVDPIRGTRPSNEEVARRSWGIARCLMESDPGWITWMPGRRPKG